MEGAQRRKAVSAPLSAVMSKNWIRFSKEMTKGRDSLLKENETLISSLQEQVRTLTLEVLELRTLQRRRKDVEHAMKPEIADLEEKLKLMIQRWLTAHGLKVNRN